MNYDPNWQQGQQGYQPEPGTQATLTVSDGNPDAVSVTIRAGSASDPVIIFKGKDNATVADLMGAAEATGVLALVAQTSKALKTHFMVGDITGGTPMQSPASAEQQYYQQNQQQQPQNGYQGNGQPQGGYQGQNQQQQPAQGQQPPGPAPQCPHGVKIFKPAGVSNTGKSYGATWNCPVTFANWKDPNGCKAQYINSR